MKSSRIRSVKLKGLSLSAAILTLEREEEKLIAGGKWIDVTIEFPADYQLVEPTPEVNKGCAVVIGPEVKIELWGVRVDKKGK